MSIAVRIACSLPTVARIYLPPEMAQGCCRAQVLKRYADEAPAGLGRRKKLI
jgi:hypothetical protein